MVEYIQVFVTYSNVFRVGIYFYTVFLVEVHPSARHLTQFLAEPSSYTTAGAGVPVSVKRKKKQKKGDQFDAFYCVRVEY